MDPGSDTVRAGSVIAAFFGAAAVLGAFLPLWLADRALSPAEIGFMLGTGSLLKVAGVPGGGWLGDRLGRPRVLAAAAALAAVTAAVLPGLHGMWPLLAAVAVLGVGASVLSPLADAVTLALAGAGRLDYGRTRAWGSISYMLATAGAGLLLARTGTGAVPFLLAAGYGAAALLGLRLPDAAPPRHRPAGPAPWHDRRFRLALVATALVQGSHGAYYSFAPLLWRSAGIGDGTIGLLVAEGILAEIALFLWGRRLVQRLGPPGLTALAAAACIVRWTATAFTTEVGVLAAVQLLHGVTFAFQHLSAMGVLARLPGRAGMAQAVLSAAGFSLATAGTVWLTGRLYAPLGSLCFLPMAVFGGAALLTVRPLAATLREGQAPRP